MNFTFSKKLQGMNQNNLQQDYCFICSYNMWITESLIKMNAYLYVSLAKSYVHYSNFL